MSHQKRAFVVAAAVAAWLSAAAAQTNPFEPAAIVDEQIITRYDVSQRAKQIAIDGGGDELAFREQALESLISETLLRNAALQVGMFVTQEQVSERLSLLAQARGAGAAELVAFFESQEVDALTIGRWIENQLLQEAYILSRFQDRAEEAVQPADINRELKRYERDQFIEILVHQLAFGLLNDDGIREVRELRQRILQAMEDGASFPEIAANVSASSAAVDYRNLGWQSEQAFQDPRLIGLMVSLQEGSVGPAIEFGNGGVSLFYVEERRVRTLPGVEPLIFDIVIFSAESPPGATNAQVEASIGTLDKVREEGTACSADTSLPAGIERRDETGINIAAMSLQNRFAVLDLEVGGVSETALSDRRDGGGGAVAWMFALCGLGGGIPDDAAREVAMRNVRQQLVNAELTGLGNEHLRELRQLADIKIR